MNIAMSVDSKTACQSWRSYAPGWENAASGDGAKRAGKSHQLSA